MYIYMCVYMCVSVYKSMCVRACVLVLVLVTFVWRLQHTCASPPSWFFNRLFYTCACVADPDEFRTEEERLDHIHQAIRHNIFKLGAYLALDLRSWRVQLLLAPMDVGAFCAREELPLACVQTWIRRPPTDDCIGLGFHDRTGPDPFWLVRQPCTGPSSSPSAPTSLLCLTRAAQFFMREFSRHHRPFLDTLLEFKVGDGADDDREFDAVGIDDDFFVDAAHELKRVQAAQVYNRSFLLLFSDSVGCVGVWVCVCGFVCVRACVCLCLCLCLCGCGVWVVGCGCGCGCGRLWVGV